MRKLASLLSAAVLAALPVTTADAQRDSGRDGQRNAGRIGVPQETSYELVVFEADGCNFCEAFRTDALPLYRASQLGREAPIRFVNVSRSDETKMGLNSAITIVPSIVLLHKGQEVDRIVGYPGPGNLMKLVNFMMGRGE